MELMQKKGLTDVLVFAGGIIPDEDVPHIKKMGIKEVFGPGTPLETIIEFVRKNAPRRI
jgi:methylmalonyl-CoA mutase C-terminal domain/subunit